MRFVSAAPVSQDHLQAGGDRRARQLHGAHQGVPGEHRGRRERQGRAARLRQDLRAHAGARHAQGVQESRRHCQVPGVLQQ